MCSFKLAEATNDHNPYRIDAVLQTAQEASKLWRNLLECRYCAYNQDQEVVQIALMTIRILLLRFQNLVPPCDQRTSSSREGRVIERAQHSSEEGQAPWQKYGVRLTLEAYEVSESESNLVTRVLLLAAIRNIKSLFLPFQEMIERKQSLLQPKSDRSSGGRGQRQPKNSSGGQSHPASNLDHIKYMLQGLGNFLQTLERAFDQDPLDKNCTIR